MKFAPPKQPGAAASEQNLSTTKKPTKKMITYKIVEKKKPGTQDFKYYGQIATVKPMGIRELCKKVAHAAPLQVLTSRP